MADEPQQAFKVRENKGYLEMMIEGLLLKVQEASKDGPGEYLEITIEMIWTNIPTAEKRTLLQVRSEDAVEADEIFTTLMGEDVEHRRKFIEENALDVRNLDV